MKRSRRLVVVPDTNLFFQCRTLQELPWRELGDYSEIEVLVVRPVQKEIDLHKGGGNDRRQRRARDASSLLRSVIANGSPLMIQTDAPQVVLSLRLDLKPDPAMANALNYIESDDVLVGVVHGLAASDLDQDVAILTDDTGVMASATATQLRYIAIPEHWRLPATVSNESKELKAAQAEIKRLQRQEASFRVRCSEVPEGIRALELEVPVAPPLTNLEIERLVEFATLRFPKKEDFSGNTTRSPEHRQQGLDLASVMGLGTPPSHQQIADYGRAYDHWTKEMRTTLAGVHRSLLAAQQDWPKISFVADNVGTRPASDVLVEIVATGPLLVSLDEPRGRDIENLPPPPVPPKGGLFDLLASVQASQTLFGNRTEFINHRDLFLPKTPKHREADGFYYRERDFTVAHDRLELECQLWRHGLEPEVFSARLNLKNFDKGRGTIEFRIHASNLSQPVCQTIPVTLTPKHLSTFEYARDLLQRLRLASSD